jgi:hypothetical protein
MPLPLFAHSVGADHDRCVVVDDLFHRSRFGIFEIGLASRYYLMNASLSYGFWHRERRICPQEYAEA